MRRSTSTILPFGAVLMVTLLTSPLQAVVTPGALLNFEAAADVNGNNIWESTTATQSRNWNIGGAQSPSAVVDPNAPGITAAYNFPSAAGSAGTYSSAINAANDDATIELWVNTNDLNGKHVLFDTGGNGSGAAIEWNGRDIVFTVQQSPTQRMLAAGQFSTDPSGSFHQIVGTIDFLGGGAGRIDLYLDGQHVSSSTIGAGFSSFAGGDGSGLGQIGSGSVAGIDNSLRLARFSDFDGQIAINRFYAGTALSASQVNDNFAAVAVSPAAVERSHIFENLEFNWDAAAPGTAGATQWRTNHSPNGTADLRWNINGPVTLEAVTSATTKINAAYNIPGSGSIIAIEDWDNDLAPRSQENATFEFWFKPNSIDGQQMLLEMGGVGSGTAFFIDNGDLEFVEQTANDTNEAEARIALSPNATDDLHQVVGTIDVSTGTIQLFLDGTLVASDTNAGLNDWAGGNPLGIGSIGGNSAADNFGSLSVFDGQFALLRYYRGVVLGVDDVVINYEALLAVAPIPEPATLGLLVVGAAGLMGRRRRQA